MKKNAVNSIGRFDLAKGVAMLATIIWHISLHYDLKSAPLFFSIYDGLNKTLFLATNHAFFLMAGYGLRKQGTKKMFSMQAKQVVKPYLFSSISIIVLYIPFNYFSLRPLSLLMEWVIRIGGGMLMGIRYRITLFGIQFLANGPGWFILNLFWSCCICNWALNSLPKKLIFPLSLLAYIFCTILEPYFPFYSILGGLGWYIIIYIGYFAKEHKILDQYTDKLFNLMLLIILAASVCYLLPATDAAGRVLKLIPSSFIRNTLRALSKFAYELFWATFFVLLFLKLSAVKNRLLDWISIIGRYSLDVYLVHTVEFFALPWYLFAAKFADRPVLGFFAESVLRCTLIFIVSTGLHYFKFYKRDLFDWTRKKCNRSVSS